jgi:light-harvesting complex 1 beta chain
MAHENVHSIPHRRGSKLDGFWGIFVVLFAAFFVIAMGSLLCAQNWRTFLPGAEGARSMLDGVKTAVYTVISQLS